jgi:hypothetical protein
MTEFHFFQIERKFFFGYPTEFNEAFIGITPKTLDTFDADFTRCKEEEVDGN